MTMVAVTVMMMPRTASSDSTISAVIAAAVVGLTRRCCKPHDERREEYAKCHLCASKPSTIIIIPIVRPPCKGEDRLVWASIGRFGALPSPHRQLTLIEPAFSAFEIYR